MQNEFNTKKDVFTLTKSIFKGFSGMTCHIKTSEEANDSTIFNLHKTNVETKTLQCIYTKNNNVLSTVTKLYPHNINKFMNSESMY